MPFCKPKKNSDRSDKKYRHNFLQQIIIVVKRYSKDDCSLKANALTYQTLFALVPMITLFIVFLAYVPQLSSAKNQVQSLIYKYLLPSSSDQVIKYLDEFAARSSDITLIGVLLLIYTGASLLSTIEKVFNGLWGVHHVKQNIFNTLKYWLIIATGPLLLSVAAILYSTVSSITFLNNNFSGYSIDVGMWLAVGALGFLVLGLTLLFWVIPSCQVPIKQAFFSAVIVTILLEVLRSTFSFIIGSFSSYGKIYGAFASIPIMLIWINAIWNIILLGMELTIVRTYDVVKQKSYVSMVDAMVSLLNKFHQVSIEGKSLNEYEIRENLGHPLLLSWSKCCNLLIDNGGTRLYSKYHQHINVALADVHLSDLLIWLDQPYIDNSSDATEMTKDEQQDAIYIPEYANPSVAALALKLPQRPTDKTDG